MLLNTTFLNNPYIYKGRTPINIPCSLCYKGILKYSKYINEKSAHTKAADKERYHDPSAEDVACYSLVCNNNDCGESYMVVGNEFIDFEYVEDEYSDYPQREEFDIFRPLFFTPTLHFFNLHKSIPSRIKEELLKSFNLFFSDYKSAANKVRISLELLMTELQIPEFNPKGKDITLHGRIKLFEASNSIIGEQLLSIKIVGNSGSHSSNAEKLGLERSDVVTAYEIIEHVLDELYVRNDRISEAKLKAQTLVAKSKQSNTLSSESLSPPSA